jgi:hypothetical protein
VNFTPRQERALDIVCGIVADAAVRHDWDAAEKLLDELFRRSGLDPPSDSLGITEASGDA